MTTTVGQTFIDRAFGVDISNSIVKVVRFPPTPSELENPLRCASLAPESSARPRKRGFEEFTEDLQAKLRRAAYGKHYGPEQLTSSQSVNKRQRKQGRDLDDADNRVRPIHLSGISENIALQTSLQNSILQQSSSILGNDSQRSPGTKRTLSASKSGRRSADLHRTQSLWQPFAVFSLEPARAGVVHSARSCGNSRLTTQQENLLH